MPQNRGAYALWLDMQDHTTSGWLPCEHGAEAGLDRDRDIPERSTSEGASYYCVPTLTCRHAGPDILTTAIADRPGAVESA